MIGQELPITYEILDSYANSLYYLFSSLRVMSYNQLVNYQGTTSFTMSLDTTRRDAVFEGLGVSRKTFNGW